MEDYKMYLSGYNKTISKWLKSAKEAGIENVIGYWSTFRYRNCTEEHKLTTDQILEGLDAVQKAEETLKLFIVSKLDRSAILKHVVKDVDAVYIVSYPTWSNLNFRIYGSVYLLQIAIDMKKTIYLFNQTAKKWFIYSKESDFKPVLFKGIPPLEKSFAVGGASKINKYGEKAIEDIFKNLNNE